MVPSLYVRVYRYRSLKHWKPGCSLIICEGVSNFDDWYNEQPLFPHYM